MGFFVANFLRFPAVQKCWKSVKVRQSYRQLKGGNFFETQCRRMVDSAYRMQKLTEDVFISSKLSFCMKKSGSRNWVLYPRSLTWQTLNSTQRALTDADIKHLFVRITPHHYVKLRFPYFSYSDLSPERFFAVLYVSIMSLTRCYKTTIFSLNLL